MFINYVPKRPVYVGQLRIGDDYDRKFRFLLNDIEHIFKLSESIRQFYSGTHLNNTKKRNLFYLMPSPTNNEQKNKWRLYGKENKRAT
jgi:hypothetical protein